MYRWTWAVLCGALAFALVGVMTFDYVAEAGKSSTAKGRPALSPPTGPPVSPPVGPPASPPIGPPGGTVEVCHVKGKGTWDLTSLPEAGKAVEAHLRQGDGLPGQLVPGMPEYFFDADCVPALRPSLVFAPVDWTIELDTHGEGVHTIFMIANVSPLDVDGLEGLGGRLVWDETEVALCFVSVRGAGEGFLRIGDGFQTTEGCPASPGMQGAFDDFGLPETACLSVTTRGVTDEYCAPLNVID